MTNSRYACYFNPMNIRHGNHAVYVSLNGNDRWSGTVPEPAADRRDGPFATLERARRAVREMVRKGLPRGGVTIFIRGGNYYLDKTLVLGPGESGRPGAPVVWRAYRHEQVRLIGGVPVTAWSQGKGHILVADLAPLGLGRLGPYPDMGWNMWGAGRAPNTELFWEGRPMEPACWPKGKGCLADLQVNGWACIGAVPEQGANPRFSCPGLKGKAWTRLDEARVHLFPDYDWADDVRGVGSFDSRGGTLTLKSKTVYPPKAGRRFRVLNVFEELSEPGEWFLDRRRGKLYFIPPTWPEPGEVVLSTLETVLQLKAARHVTVRGLTVECGREDVVRVDGGSDCRIAGCTIRNAGIAAIGVGGGQRHTVSGCDLYDLGRSGAVISGGDRETLVPAGHLLDNCHIHRYGRLVKCYGTGVNVNGVGNRIAHCEIHDGPHSAILLHGNDHRIEYNRIHHVVQESSDAGAFYMGRDWTEQGNVIRYNCFHDIGGLNCAGSKAPEGFIDYASPANTCAIYLDDCASGTAIYGNLFYRVPLLTLHMAGGKDNRFENNVVVGSTPAVVLCWRSPTLMYNTIIQRLMTTAYGRAAYDRRYPRLRQYLMGNMQLPERAVVRRNIFAYADDNVCGPWMARTGKGIATVYDLEHWDPETAVVDRNLFWHGGQPIRVRQARVGEKQRTVDRREWGKMGFDRGSRVGDPLFVNAAGDDYRLKASSPAFKLGFKAIPIARIGLYRSPDRATWPVDIERPPVPAGIRSVRVALE